MNLEQIIKEAESNFDETFLIHSGRPDSLRTHIEILMVLTKLFLTEQIRLAVVKTLDKTKLEYKPLREVNYEEDSLASGFNVAVAEQAKKIEELLNT